MSKVKFKECKIGRDRYRIVECQTCGKVFNACSNGSIAGIMYQCPEANCRAAGRGTLVSVDKETASEFIRNRIENTHNDSIKQYAEKAYHKIFEGQD